VSAEAIERAARKVWDSQNAYRRTVAQLRSQEWSVVEVDNDAMADLGEALGVDEAGVAPWHP
jgi:hypothetical protein